MKWGVICPSTDRGLGIQGWELVRNMAPDRVLVVDIAPSRHAPHPERFPGATFLRSRDGSLPEREVREWLDGLSVVVFAETPFEWQIPTWARRQGCATVCWVNPEFHRDRGGTPSVYWAPSSWRLDYLPPKTRRVPVPVPTDRWPDPPKPEDIGKPLRWLHVGGTKAVGDRNGEEIVIAATRRARETAVVTMRAQDRVGHPPVRSGTRVQVVRALENAADYWSMYEGHDVLVMPRRFGGLTLPCLEAMGAGLAVVMTGCSPQVDDWPIVPLPWTPGRPVSVPADKRLPTAAADPVALARLMDEWARNPELVVEARRRAQGWAQANSWAKLAPFIQGELEWAADRA